MDLLVNGLQIIHANAFIIREVSRFPPGQDINLHRTFTANFDLASFWLDPETAKISIEKILHIVEAAQTGEKVKQ